LELQVISVLLHDFVNQALEMGLANAREDQLTFGIVKSHEAML
jgi:hypothetical protein